MQLLIHRASALALLEDEQKFKLGGVLTAIISCSGHQLLENKRALHYVPIIFCLILISSSSFGSVLISGEYMTKRDEFGPKPRPTGLS